MAVALLLAVVVYGVLFALIEHRRARNGPWRVTFTNDASAPAIVINQPALAITNVEIIFPREPAPTNSGQTMVFDQLYPVPYAVPFGTNIFMDTTFLPGTVVFDLFGHQIQLMPRVLTIDKKEMPWRSGGKIAI